MQRRYRAICIAGLTLVIAIQFSISVFAFTWPWSRKKTKPAETTAQTTTQAVSKAAEKTENKGKSQIDIVNYLGAINNVKFELSEEQENYINSNIRLFPAGEKDKVMLEKRINYSLDYKHMKKSPQKYMGKFAYIEDLEVVQIWEDPMVNPKMYDYATRINAVDGEGNCYYIFYIGKSLDVVEDSRICVTAMPIDNGSYTAAVDSNRTVLTLVMLASEVKDTTDDQEYISDPAGAAKADGYFYSERGADNWESEFVFPYSDIDFIPDNELRAATDEQLRIGKNEIYASHGRMFTSQDLQQYFNSCSWYKPSIAPENFDESVFNDCEKDNIRRIQAEIDRRK